jgi:hypothetical protein
MKTKSGILYGLKHPAWNQYKKMGRTSQTIKKRISNMQTSLLGNIDIIYTTNTLVDSHFYEYLMKQILKNYRIKPNKEMFVVYDDEIKEIFETFNYINLILDTDEKLNNYIENFYPEYLKKKKYIKSEKKLYPIYNKKKLKKKAIYIDTTY